MINKSKVAIVTALALLGGCSEKQQTAENCYTIETLEFTGSTFQRKCVDSDRNVVSVKQRSANNTGVVVQSSNSGTIIQSTSGDGQTVVVGGEPGGVTIQHTTGDNSPTIYSGSTDGGTVVQETSGSNSPAIQTGGNLTINFSKGDAE